MNTTALEPFGLLVELEPGTAWADLSAQTLHRWISEHRVVVLRGLVPLRKRTMPIAARRLGPLQAWSFGAVNVLAVDPDKHNYLFTASEVPLHWDGAFKGEIPNYLMFHCLEAPPADAGGRTVFVDTHAVWEGQSADVQQAWKRAGFRYTTDKVVHYGGVFESPLVATHPLTGLPILRFAEPVVGLNPVAVEPLVADGPSIQSIAQALRAPEHRLSHQWQDNDVVLADNHGLLHGRESFVKGAPRVIHRVNVLDPARTWWQPLVDSLRIRRPEFMVAEVPINLLPLLWIAPAAEWLGTALYWEATGVFFLLFHFGDMVNCLADRELDAVYKTTLSEAVMGLGVRNVTRQIAGTAALALLLTTHLAWMTGRWWLIPLVFVGLVFAHQYSYGPLKLKSRGLVQIPTLWTVIFVGPMLLMTGALVGWPTWSLLAFIGLYGAMAQAIIIVNTAEDFDEDFEAGLHTSAHALGRAGSIWTASAGVFVAGAGLLALFVSTFAAEAAAGAVWFCLGLWVSAWCWATVEIAHLAWRAGRANRPDAVLKLGAMKMPVWITVMANLTLLVVGARAWAL